MDKQIKLTGDELEKIDNVINGFLQNGARDNPPKFIILTGPIASGKTTIRREKYSKDYVLVDSGELFDIFKANFSAANSEKLEEYLMVTGIELVKKSINEKKNIVIEISADTKDKGERMISIYDKMTSLGYKSEISVIDCDLEECQRRNEKGRDNVSSYYSTDETLHYFILAFENM